MLERIQRPGWATGFYRYRPYLDFVLPRARLSPFWRNSMTFLADGFYRYRSQVGLKWRLSCSATASFAYQFETIHRAGHYLPRHVLRSSFSLDPLGENPCQH